MKSLIETITSVLTSNGINYRVNEDQNRIQLGMGGKNGNWQVVVNLNEETRQLSFVSICPINTPDSRQSAICELLNRINDNIFIGKFTMDVEDGQILCKTSSAYPESYLGDETVNMMFHLNVSTFDSYMPAIIAVLYGFNEPALAFLEIQQVLA